MNQISHSPDQLYIKEIDLRHFLFLTFLTIDYSWNLTRIRIHIDVEPDF